MENREGRRDENLTYEYEKTVANGSYSKHLVLSNRYVDY